MLCLLQFSHQLNKNGRLINFMLFNSHFLLEKFANYSNDGALHNNNHIRTSIKRFFQFFFPPSFICANYHILRRAKPVKSKWKASRHQHSTCSAQQCVATMVVVNSLLLEILLLQLPALLDCWTQIPTAIFIEILRYFFVLAVLINDCLHGWMVLSTNEDEA